VRFPSKKAFIADIEFEYRRLEDLFAELNESQLTQAGICGAGHWSIKDMLARLHEWHCMAMRWYEVGLRGIRDDIPAAKDIPSLNRRIFQKHKGRPLKQVIGEFRHFHEQLMKLINSLSEKELLSPGHFAWCRKNPLTTYLAPNTCSHYRWAIRHIRRWRRQHESPNLGIGQNHRARSG
jgi:hypothetical protein